MPHTEPRWLPVRAKKTRLNTCNMLKDCGDNFYGRREDCLPLLLLLLGVSELAQWAKMLINILLVVRCKEAVPVPWKSSVFPPFLRCKHRRCHCRYTNRHVFHRRLFPRSPPCRPPCCFLPNVSSARQCADAEALARVRAMHDGNSVQFRYRHKSIH